MIDISKLTIVSAREGLKSGKFTARELTQTCLDTIEEKDKEIHAFLEVFSDALEQADRADLNLPLGGIPIAIKDNITYAGHHSRAGSKILEGFVSPTDSTVVRKLKEAGAVIIGRTNMDEFAMGSSTENSAYGVTKNPHDTSRVAGGTSGGSAAAVASGMCIAALGSDTGGSVRQPAAFCGVIGLKPTYGRVSRSGLIAMTSSFDQIGPLTKTIEDAEILHNVIRGQDPMDSTTVAETTFPAHGQASGNSREKSLRLGVPRSFVESEGVTREVKKNFEENLKKFESLGYKIVDIELPSLEYALAVYYIIMPAEASSNLARFDGVKYGLHVDGANSIDDYFKSRGAGFGPEVRRRIILGTYVLSSGYYDAYYGNALRAREYIRDELRESFKKVDLILTPTTPSPAWKIGEKSKDPLTMYVEDIFTVTANISSCPAISLPSGFVEVGDRNLPIGIQLTADLGREDNLFQAGKDLLRTS